MHQGIIKPVVARFAVPKVDGIGNLIGDEPVVWEPNGLMQLSASSSVSEDRCIYNFRVVSTNNLKSYSIQKPDEYRRVRAGHVHDQLYILLDFRAEQS